MYSKLAHIFSYVSKKVDRIIFPYRAFQVRYQSRKRLAEQRPRVRGQFVRQVMYENESKDKVS